MKARLRRWSGIVFRPVAVAFDPRLEGLEHRLVQRMGEMERRVATDAEITAEMTITQSRLLARLESRLGALEERLAVAPQVEWSSGPVAVAWTMGNLSRLHPPARIALSSPSDAGLPVAVVALGFDVVLLEPADAAVPDHPRIQRTAPPDGGGSKDRDLDAAVVLCADGAAGPEPLDAALVAYAAARLRTGGMLLLATPQPATGGLDELLGGLQVEETTLAAPGPSGMWEVVRGGGPATDGVTLLRAVATR